jgi:hypothetical protein
LAWHGAGGGHAGAGVQMSTITLQVARAMPAWSVNWCACSNAGMDTVTLCQTPKFFNLFLAQRNADLHCKVMKLDRLILYTLTAHPRFLPSF